MRPQDQFERGPEHSHQANQFETAADVLLVFSLKGPNLSFLLHVGADQARSGKILLGSRGDVGEHGLNAFEAVMNAAAEILDHDAGYRKRQKCIERQPGADRDHESEGRGHQDSRVGRVHDGRTQQVPHRAEVVGGARHNVAGVIALIVGIGQALKEGEEIVAQIELDVAGDADHDPARKKLENALAQCDADQQSGEEEELVARHALVQGVGGHAEHPGHLDQDRVGEQNATRARDVTPAVAFQVGQQRAQVLRKHQIE
jgi:hypothetical protein